LPVARVVHLDPTNDTDAIIEGQIPSATSDIVLYEGMLSGADAIVKGLLHQMDAVLLLEPPAILRFLRSHRRDGFRGTMRWWRNEWYWWTVSRPLVMQHCNISRVTWLASGDLRPA
jgi:hypothetical protein